MRLVIPVILTVLTLPSTVAVAAVKLPPPPEWAMATPIRVSAEVAESVTFNGALFRVPLGTKIGASYRIPGNKVVKELRWDINPGRSREFDVRANDRLRELGYKVLDPTTSAFAESDAKQARYQMAAVVNTVEQDYFLKPKGYFEVSDESYGRTILHVELQVQDSESQEVVFQKAYRGYGLEQGRDPRPIIPAFLNALEHALADPELVARLSAAAPTTGGPQSTAWVALTVPACDRGVMALPAGLNGLAKSVVVVRSGAVRGTAVVISPEGFALTAAHLTKGQARVGVKLESGLELDAEVLRADAKSDLALLRLPGRGYPCVPVVPKSPSVGENVFVVGTPLGEGFAGSVSRGVVSATRQVDGIDLVQTDASINPGSSGGPLLDRNGQLLGIVSFKVAAPGVEGLGFGVATSNAASRLAVTLR